MKKVLVFLHEEDLAPVGGPKGYNYNLLLGMDDLCECDIQVEYLSGKSSSQSINSKINSLKNGLLIKIIQTVKSVVKKGLLMYGHFHRARIDINQYDAVHFHIVMDMYSVKDSLKNYSGKVLLTPHTPTMPSKEVFSLLSPFEKKYMKWFYKKLAYIDEYAFDRADYIILPCEEAEEPYYHEWPGYENIHDRNAKKYRYIPTGIMERKTKSPRNEFRGKYGIPDNAFVVSYVGRHNEIKGYDRLKNIAEKILVDNPNCYFLIGGKEQPLAGLNHDRWIELGWTDDPGAIIEAGDVFILPNRETYFDLVFLEVLSMGQIVIASKTGGNMWFSKFNCKGISLFETDDEAADTIQMIIDTTIEEREEMRVANRNLYEQQLTHKIFARRYFNLLQDIFE